MPAWSATVRGRVVVLAVALAALGSLAALAQEEVKTGIGRPLSPGVVASLVGRTKEPAVVARLTEALKDPKPEVRAAAARVINVSGVLVLVPDLRTALATEPDLAAATEQAWALSALGGASENEALVSAARRLGGVAPGRIALVLARTQGPGAVAYSSLLTEGPPVAERWNAFLSLAIGEDQATLGRVAVAVLREGRALAWRALLGVARGSELNADPGLLVAGLQHPESGVRIATCWHLASLLADGQPLPEMVAAAAAALLDTPVDPTLDPFDALGREILGRALGRPAARSGVWIAALRDKGTRSRAWPSFSPRVFTYLTGDERKAADLSARAVPKRPESKRAKPPEPRRRSPGGYPPQFVTDVLAVSGCEPAPHLAPAMAEVIAGQDGRPRRVAFLKSQLTPSCEAAGRTLLLTALPPLEMPSSERVPEILILPFQPSFVECLGTGELEPTAEFPTSATVTLEYPKVLYEEGFGYSKSARRAGSEGTVEIETMVTTNGCVGGFRIVEGRDPKLYWEVVLAKFKNKYSPMLIGGLPVPSLFLNHVRFRPQESWY